MSRWDCPLELLAVTSKKDAYGVRLRQEVARKVIGNRLTLSLQSFFSASLAGMRPDAVVQLRASEYQGETEARLDGKRFSVVRVEKTGPELVRLTLTEEVGDRCPEKS